MNKSASSRLMPRRTIALIGMMAAGKSSVGVCLAQELGMPFVDSDAVMEKESGLSIAAYFERYGEDKFRVYERETVAKILAGDPCVLAVGGGAFMNAETRALLKRRAATIWIRAEKGILLDRALQKADARPMLKGDPDARMTALLAAREPIYAEADVTIDSDGRPVETTVARALDALKGCARAHQAAS